MRGLLSLPTASAAAILRVGPQAWRLPSRGARRARSSFASDVSRTAQRADRASGRSRRRISEVLNFLKIRTSLAQIEKSQQENPKSIHEMPVVGSDFRRRGQRNARIVEFANQNVEQRADSTEQMQAVGSSENVEKTAGRIAGHKDALSNELPPRDELADQKKSAEPCRHDP